MPVKVFSQTRPRQLSEVVKVEVHPDYSRDDATLKAGVALQLGQPVAKITTAGSDKGKLVAFDPAGTNGSQTVVGVSQMDVEADTADVDNVVYSARGSVLALVGLRGIDALTADQLAALLAALTALTVVVRTF